MRRCILVALLTSAALVAPATAGASSITMTADAGPAANTYVRVRAAPGEHNRVSVQLRKRTMVIADHGVERLRIHDIGFGTCDRLGPRTVVCPRVPVVALLRDGDDTFVARPGGRGHDHPRKHPLELQEDYSDTEGAIIETTIVSAGSGDDVVKGSRGPDSIVPGPGRDVVDGRGGGDAVYAGDDGAKDRLAGGAGIDSVSYESVHRPVWIDLAVGIGRVHRHDDSLSGFERAHGGPKDDVLAGSRTADALYGEEGRDHLAGRRGNDLLVGDSPIDPKAFANFIVGGPGSDVIDARGYAQAPPPAHAHLTTDVDCGAGRDRELGETDDLLDRSCEGAVFRIPNSSGYLLDEHDLYSVTMPVSPVASDADSVTYEVPCPPIEVESNAGCHGSITLTRPPVGGEAPDELYGSATFDLEPGERKAVRVELTPAGQQARADRDPVDVQVASNLSQGAGHAPEHARFGWEQLLGPG